MSQPPSQPDPRHNRLRGGRHQRVLRAPHERFADVEPPAGGPAPVAESEEIHGEHHDPFAPPSYSDEEMEWRRLPPSERRKRAKLQRKGPRSKPPKTAPHGHEAHGPEHERRAAAARGFSHHARADAPPGAKKRKSKRWGVWFLRVGLAALVIAVGEGAVFALSSPKMKIDSVDVTGMSTTPADKVNAIVHQLVGQNVVRARTKLVETQLEKLPTVSGAHVGRLLSWPPRATVRLDERQAMAVVGAGENLLVVDQTGMPFRKANLQGQDRDLVSVGLIDVNVQLGKRLPDKHWSRISEWLTALQDDNKTGSWTWKPRRVFYDKDAISMWVPASPTAEKGPELLIRLGGDRWEEKLARARETLAYFGRTGRDAETLDLVSYDRPVWHPRDQVKTADKTGGRTETVNPAETPAAEATPEAPAPVAPTATAPHLAHGDAAGHREG